MDEQNDLLTAVLPDRRRFLTSLAFGSAALMIPCAARGQLSSHVVVLGGGFAGATVAKYLKIWGGDALTVTLVEKNAGHYSCIMSNLVLNGQRALADLHFGYDTLVSSYGVNVLRDQAEEVDAAGQRIRLRGAGWLGYDRLVLAPGISFNAPPGWNDTLIPHAWIAGLSTQQLADRLSQIPAGGTFVMAIPPAPYRCPPGPYERACLIAGFLKSRSPANPGQVVVLDANPRIMAERETFGMAFDTLYAGIVDYRTGVVINAVDSPARTLATSAGDFSGDVVNLIPPHRAADIVRDSGLTGAGDWAPVDPLSYASTLAGFETIHVIGDSQATGQPKSGHMANAQAKICADAVIRLLAGQALDTPERLDSVMTNSACFSPVTATQASWLTAVYAYNAASGQMQLSGTSLGEAGKWTTENFEDMNEWSETLFADTFGVNARTEPEPFLLPAQSVPVPPWAAVTMGGALAAARWWAGRAAPG